MPNDKLPLKIAIATYEHTAAVKDGRAPIEGVAPDFVEISPIIAAFRRMVRDVEFDVCEMAPATYMIARAAGAPFKALPVFVFRRFHHGGFVYRSDAGIGKPKDLEGKKAGVRAYSVSTGIWTRGILQNDCGVDISKVTWVVDDEEHVTSLRLPSNVVHAPQGQSLVSMMADGSLQAAFTGPAGIGRSGAPKEGWDASSAQQAPSYAEMFPDTLAAERDWYQRTGIYPVHGLIVVKDELLAAHPWLAKSLFDAFVKSKELWLEQLKRGVVKSDTDRHYQAMSEIVGDPLPLGIAPNRPAIEALIQYSYQQGLLPKHYSIDELFVDPQAV
ncbi:ABC transporter substrate-binding protein [Paraburkholderia caffeinilytica]|uniref:ABC transporter substrate-binding protein n=1 Tax=Paraburkholderia caffeinilytica TaxID=1761016 RepID=UPI003DA1040D